MFLQQSTTITANLCSDTCFDIVFGVWTSESNRYSGAILQYLVEYDPTHKVSVIGVDEKYNQLKWLFFQASGQGPYFGQVAWFLSYRPEKVPSAFERYRVETKRVLGVL